MRMATGPSYRVPFRRRREGKTDYRLRRGLVLSRVPRLVIRGSHRNFTAQVITAEANGDKVLVSANSGELVRDYGWLGDPGNIPAAYLVGLLCGLKAVSQGVKKAVLDIGLQYPSKGARVFAALKGAADSGLVMSLDKEKFPSDKRIMGQHISEYAKRLASNPEAYHQQFSGQLAKGLKPEEIVSHFDQVKEKIVSSSKRAKLPSESTEDEAKPSDEESEEATSEEELVEEE